MKISVKSLLLVSALATITCVSCKKNKIESPLKSAAENNDLASIPCIPGNLSANMLAFYPFSNGSINDFSGNGHHLTNTTTAHAAADRNGNTNCAFEFTSDSISTDFISASSTTFLNSLTKLSISLWYQPLDSTRNGGSFETLVSRGDTPGCPDRAGDWSVGLYDCRKAVFGRQNSVWDNNITNFNCSQEVSVRTGTWHHLAAVFDQTSNTMSIYRDGILQDTATGIANCGFSGNPTIQDIGDLFLGKSYTGRLDDVILFNSDLGQSEINQLYSMGTCCSE